VFKVEKNNLVLFYQAYHKKEKQLGYKICRIKNQCSLSIGFSTRKGWTLFCPQEQVRNGLNFEIIAKDCIVWQKKYKINFIIS